MADKREQVSMEELTMSNYWQLEGLCVLLQKKGIITVEEVMTEARAAQVKAEEKRRGKGG